MFNILETTTTREMENDVLNFCKEKKNALLRMEEGTFAGEITMDERVMYLKAYNELVGEKTMRQMSWTCSGCMKNFAHQLMNAIRAKGWH